MLHLVKTALSCKGPGLWTKVICNLVNISFLLRNRLLVIVKNALMIAILLLCYVVVAGC